MNKIKRIIKEQDDRILFLEEKFDEALIGTGRSCGKTEVAVYNASKCIEILINIDEMDEFDALEKFERSVDKVVSGTYKPIFINDFRRIKEIPDFEIKNNMTIEDLFS